MSEKKNFKVNNPALQFISEAGNHTQEKQEAQEVYNTHEEHAAHEKAQQIGKTTQGRKGHHLPRINMAFSEDNLRHIRIMGRIEGCSATEYVNRLIMADRAKQAETLKKAAQILKGE